MASESGDGRRVEDPPASHGLTGSVAEVVAAGVEAGAVEWLQVAPLDVLVDAYTRGSTAAGLEIADRVLAGLGLLVPADESETVDDQGRP